MVHVNWRFYPEIISESVNNIGVCKTWTSLDIIFTNKQEGGPVIRAGTAKKMHHTWRQKVNPYTCRMSMIQPPKIKS